MIKCRKSSILISLLIAGCSFEEGQMTVSNAPGSTNENQQNLPVTGEIFKASNSVENGGCEANPLANYWKCPRTLKSYKAEQPSPIDNSFLQSLTYINRIKYVFRCKTSAVPEVSELKIGDQTSVNISPTESYDLRSIDTPVTYSGSKVSIELGFSPSTIVVAPCELTLISNYSFPPIALLEEYGSELIYIEEELDEGLGLVASARTLPEKWSSLLEMSDTLIGIAKDKRRSCVKNINIVNSILENAPNSRSDIQVMELKRLAGIGINRLLGDVIVESLDDSAVCPRVRSQSECDDYFSESVSGEIGSLQMGIKEDICLARDIEKSLPESSSCLDGSNSSSAYCLTAVNKVLGLLEKNRDEFRSEKILPLVEFLSHESARLSIYSTKIAEAIDGLIEEINN